MSDTRQSAWDGTGDGPCKRLPGLWLICVFFGLCAALNFLWVPSATWLGRVVFSAFTIGFLLAAGALWTRRQWAPIVAKVVWFACLLWLCILIFPSTFLIFPIGAWLSASVILFGYLRWRKGYFEGTQPPSFTTPVSIIAMTIVTLFFCLSFIHNIDDPLMEFAELELGVQKLAAEENGYTAFERIVEEDLFIEPEGKEQDDMHWSWIRSPGDEKFEEWLPVARNMLELNVEYISVVEEMLERPYFVLPYEEIIDPSVWKMNSHARNAGRVFAARSMVELADGNAEKSLRTALNVWRLGLYWAGGHGSMVEYLTGTAVMQIGLAYLRAAASAQALNPETLRKVIKELCTDNIHDAFSNTLKIGFKVEGRELEDLRFLPDLIQSLFFLRLTFPEIIASAFEGGLEHTSPKWFHVFVADSRPLYKINMTMNRAGARTVLVHRSLEKLESYGELDFGCGPSLISLVRNPAGNMLQDSWTWMVETQWSYYWEVIADIRVTKTYLALSAYHAEHGALPESLDMLVPYYMAGVPEDPFTGRALGYDPDADRPIIYSVGADRLRADVDEQYGRDNLTLELEFLRQ